MSALLAHGRLKHQQAVRHVLLVLILVLVEHRACRSALPAMRARGRLLLAPLLLLNAQDVALVPFRLLLVFQVTSVSHVSLVRGHHIVLYRVLIAMLEPGRL